LESNSGRKSVTQKMEGFFSQLPAEAADYFNARTLTATYPKGTLLFTEKQVSRGVFVLCRGEVKLSISSSEGKTLIVRVAHAGEVLGVLATLSGNPHEATAVTLRPCEIAVVRREDFLGFIAEHPKAFHSVFRQISADYLGAFEQLRTIGLSDCAHKKVARVLLAWTAGIQKTDGGTRIVLPLTHGEIAEFIGTTRETVTRALGDFKARHLVAIKGSILIIPNRDALENVAGF